MIARQPVYRRLAPLIAASFTGSFWLWVPVEKLFLSQIGFTAQTIGLMAAAYSATVPLLDVPSALLADRWSRRGVLCIGNVSAFFACIVGGLSHNVGTYLMAAVLLGVYFAMQSGTFDAIVYDTVLEETGGSDQFEKVLGRVRIFESVALVLGALGGGLMASATSPRATYFATAPLLLVSTACLFSFREPRLHAERTAGSLRRHVRLAAGAVRGKHLLPIAGLLVLTTMLTQAVFEFGPLWLVDAHTSAGAFGPAWAALVAALGLGGALAGRLRLRSLATQALVAVLLVGAAAVLLVSDYVVVITTVQVITATLSVALGILFTRQLHDAVPSDVRTGVASGLSTFTWVIFLPFALGFGVVSQRLGIHAAGWLLVGLAVAIGGLLLGAGRLPAPSVPAVGADPGLELAA